MFFIVPVILGWLCFAILFLGYLKNKKIPLLSVCVPAIAFIVAYTVWGIYFR